MGSILRFDETRGFGFIAPADGGEDVFFHANDFGDQRQLVQRGVRVEYQAAEGDRGLKVATVRIVEGAGQPAVTVPRASAAIDDDDTMCDGLTPQQYTAEVTEVLIANVPSLTAAQISQIRGHLIEHARSHGWIEP